MLSGRTPRPGLYATTPRIRTLRPRHCCGYSAHDARGTRTPGRESRTSGPCRYARMKRAVDGTCQSRLSEVVRGQRRGDVAVGGRGTYFPAPLFKPALLHQIAEHLPGLVHAGIPRGLGGNLAAID